MKTITMTADVPDDMTPDDIMDAAYGAGFTGVALGIPQDDDDVEDALVDAELNGSVAAKRPAYLTTADLAKRALADERAAQIAADNALVDRAVASFAAELNG